MVVLGSDKEVADTDPMLDYDASDIVDSVISGDTVGAKSDFLDKYNSYRRIDEQLANRFKALVRQYILVRAGFEADQVPSWLADEDGENSGHIAMLELQPVEEVQELSNLDDSIEIPQHNNRLFVVLADRISVMYRENSHNIGRYMDAIKRQYDLSQDDIDKLQVMARNVLNLRSDLGT